MKIGNLDITNPKIGTTSINKVYMGNNKVWERFSFLLDGLTGSTGGFSLRKLKSSYTGNAVQVRRSSDNTTQDIGFVNNQLDVTSLNTFCSGTNGFVSIWYNQSDASNNLVQATSTNQPKIYDSVNGVELQNGNPALSFNGSKHMTVNNNSFASLSTLKNIVVVNKPTSDAVMMLIGKGYFSASEWTFYTLNASALGLKYRFGLDGALYFNNSSTNTILNVYSLYFASFVSNTLNGFNSYNNGQLYLQDDITTNFSGSTTYNLTLGMSSRYPGQYYFTGTMQEVLLFSSDQTSNRTTIENNINTNYTIY